MKNKMLMPKLSHIFLILSMLELFVWFISRSSNAFVYLSLPLGTVLFGLYLIVQMMEKETALYDEENRVLQPVRAGCVTEASGRTGTVRAQNSGLKDFQNATLRQQT